ncbi:MAG: CPBP family intramembrane metalloprotease [Firmicutes bacterium]|nr:CPBP family intramembrane metalloprotease [Bacillota bacterium]
MNGWEQAKTAETGVSGRRGISRRALGQGLIITSIVAAIALCEYTFAYRNVSHGIIMSLALTIFLCGFLAFLPGEDGLATSVEALTLIPVYILFTSSLPWFFISQQYLLPAVYSCVLGLCLLHIHQKGLSLRSLFGIPPRKKIAAYVLFGAAGLPLGLMEYLILRPAPSYPEFSWKYLLLNLFYMVFFVGIGEELLFRGLIQRNLSSLLGWKWGLVGTSLLFSILHLTWRSLPEMFFVFFAGLIFGIFYLRTGSLISPILIHGLNNTVLVAVFPYLL